MNDMKDVYQWLDNHYADIEKALMELLSIDSTRSEKAEGKPFGEGTDEALNYVLDLALGQGFSVENMDGYMGIIQYPGKTREKIGILSHVDVVPATAANWRFPPFSPKVHEGRIYGRGSLDDKGPLIASQFALKALKECHYHPTKSICHLIGTNEETGMACIKYYIDHTSDLPRRGFAPDAFFPVVQGEKGLLRWTCAAEWEPQTAEELSLLSFNGGTEINCVPAYAEAKLRINEAGANALSEAYSEMPDDLKRGLNIDIEGGYACIKASGVSVHASICEQGDNAISKVLQLLAKLPLYPVGADRFIKCTAELLSDALTGKSLGIYTEDEYSTTTNLLSLINVSETQGAFSCDTRYPVTGDGDRIVALLKDKANSCHLSFDLWERMDPLFYAEDDPLIKTLIEIYRDQTGEDPMPVITGAGTYARKLPGFVAFGPVFPGEKNIAHQADEFISVNNLIRMTKIYAAAICQLAE